MFRRPSAVPLLVIPGVPCPPLLWHDPFEGVALLPLFPETSPRLGFCRQILVLVGFVTEIPYSDVDHLLWPSLVGEILVSVTWPGTCLTSRVRFSQIAKLPG